MFMYLALQSVHAPLEVPEKYLAQYAGISDSSRRIYAGMVTAMDEGIGNVTKALKEAGMWDNTVLIFASDNGGWPNTVGDNGNGPATAGGNNFPLRGQKLQNFEGGTRVPAFVAGPGASLSSSVAGTDLHNLMHVTDWYPTILALAGAKYTPRNPLDGVSQLAAIRTGGKSPRSKVVYNLATTNEAVHGAIREGDWKLLFLNDKKRGSYAPENTTQYLPLGWTTNTPALNPCPPSINGAWLFNLAEDPYETTNLVATNPSKYQELLSTFHGLQEGAVQDLFEQYTYDLLSLPSTNQWHAWMPWSDKEGSTCTAWEGYKSSVGGDNSGATATALSLLLALVVLCLHL
eukprot:TRINITY_DN3867_c0_g1_i3.p1 TRINITY_DN3867_c0_g1~~TRINITY_DN3867_c0_g1_i3.p1  ORF type:complete len:346 (-),score=74.57 TRINITY_DN3867_c0_g1_i3:35-1072(-)